VQRDDDAEGHADGGEAGAYRLGAIDPSDAAKEERETAADGRSLS
jgi:hypothetical protein